MTEKEIESLLQEVQKLRAENESLRDRLLTAFVQSGTEATKQLKALRKVMINTK